MPMAADRKLLYDAIVALEPHEFKVVCRMFANFIDDYLDTHLTDEEVQECQQILERMENGEYVLLSDLPD